MRSVSSKRRVAFQAGIWAEYIAGCYLLIHGYRPLQRRYKTKFGEIDLIVKRGNTLVFVEVKARQNLTLAREAVQVRGRRRIEKTALHYIAAHPQYQQYDMRFDVIGLAFRKGVMPIHIEHLDNAWMLGA